MTFVRRLLCAALLISSVAGKAQQKAWTEREVMRAHRSAILIDGHNDITSRTVAGLDIGRRLDNTHTDAERMREGGMTAQFFAAYVGVRYIDERRAAHRVLQMIDTIRRDIVERRPDVFVFATTAAEIERARKRRRIAALIGIEGGHAIEEDLRLLRTFYDLGARYMTLTHTRHLSWAGSSGSQGEVGLNDFGREVIAEMNRLGMMVDISHVSDKTFWDTIDASRAPVFASHSSCRALANIPRNMTDGMIQAVAKKGGVVMINFGCEFLAGKDATIDDVVRHIDHVKRIAGVEAVGLGSDFDGVRCVPKSLEDVSKWPSLTRKLLENGYSAREIRMIYGGNLLRFMKAVEGAATGAGNR